ncbi:MAG: DUF1566 domain-containing protein [Proteobacteria bacterium]|nr:DUF1566 domain-containing protein [Pseudomonadota bacterium]
MANKYYSQLTIVLIAIVLFGCRDNDTKTHTEPDSGSDSDTDIDMDGDEDAGPDCRPKQYKACDEHGDIYWYDSCSIKGELFLACPHERSVCVALPINSPECQCIEPWRGENCELCIGNMDPERDCRRCLPGWDLETDCTTCSNHWEGEECDVCPGSWDSERDCSHCVGNWDPDKNCEECTPQWKGENCDTCAHHWEGVDCDVCPERWDPDKNCEECAPRWQGENCDTCAHHWEGVDCDVCPERWDPKNNCAVCIGGWGGENCDELCVRFVDVAATPEGDGLSWTTAFNSVEQGIDAAIETVETDAMFNGCEVWVAEGTYNVYQIGSVSLRSTIDMYGSFEGFEASPKERDISNHPTILSGLESDGSENHVQHVIVGADDIVIDGFFITGGQAFDDGRQSNGGGMLNSDAAVEIRNCTFMGNAVGGNGGGLAHIGGSLILKSCVFTNNGAGNDGGGVYFNGATLIAENCVFSDNGAFFSGGGMSLSERGPGDFLFDISDSTFKNNASRRGGGVYAAHSEPKFTNCKIQGNAVLDSGGGAYFYESHPFFSSSMISGNFSGMVGSGGGIYSNGRSVSIETSILANNWAEGSGGGGFFSSSGFDFVQSKFIRNYAQETGGGFEVVGSTRYQTITNCIFLQNEAKISGGGINFYNSGTEIYHSTFAGNRAGSIGGAIYYYESYGNILTGSVLWNDSPDEIYLEEEEDVDVDESPQQGYITANYNDIQGGWPGVNIDADPLFADEAAGDLSLLPGSPCIDGANGPAAPELDLDGNPRIDDPASKNSGVGPPWVDMGAYEYQLNSDADTDTDVDSDTDTNSDVEPEYEPVQCDLSAGTCYDPNSGLTWQEPPPAGKYNLEEAVEYCKGLGSGWHLPKINELRSLIRGCRGTSWDYFIESGGSCRITDSCTGFECWNSHCINCPNGRGPGKDGSYQDEAFKDVNLMFRSNSIGVDPYGFSDDGVTWTVYFSTGSVFNYTPSDTQASVRCVRD